MKTSYRYNRPSVFSEIIRPVLAGLAIAAVLMGLYFGGKAAGRREVLRSQMWTDCSGTIYIDTLYNGVVAHDNLASSVYGK